MVEVYSSHTVKDMPDEVKARIEAAGIPVAYYLDGYAPLGPSTGAAVDRFATINTLISKFQLPMPPSLNTEMIVERCNGTDRLDFREIMDGDPGTGKSTSAIFRLCRYAIAAAERYGQDPKDYFSLENCALLEDTANVTALLDELDKHQGVLIDDAGVAAGNRDFATQSNKNISAIMQTCRTKRWNVVFTSPSDEQVDLHIRRLSYGKSLVFKPCHSAGFNILKINRLKRVKWKGKTREHFPRFSYNDIKVDFYAAFSPDVFGMYKGLIEQYYEIRDRAADALIHDRAIKEAERKDPRSKREKSWGSMVKEHSLTIWNMTHTASGVPLKRDEIDFKNITDTTGLSKHYAKRMIDHVFRNGVEGL